jgi:hypothetical protein
VTNARSAPARALLPIGALVRSSGALYVAPGRVICAPSRGQLAWAVRHPVVPEFAR